MKQINNNMDTITEKNIKTEQEATKEGPVAKAIESKTAQLPSDLFLWSAISMMAVSAGLHVAGKKHAGLFVGQWVAPFLLFGIYNKLVKQSGHDAGSNPAVK
jgi:hypothetical protein